MRFTKEELEYLETVVNVRLLDAEYAISHSLEGSECRINACNEERLLLSILEKVRKM